MLLILLMVAVLAGAAGALAVRLGYWHPFGAAHSNATARSKAPSAAPTTVSAAAVAPTPSASPVPVVPQTGPGTFRFSTAAPGPVIGTSGPLHRYRVAVENGTGQDAERFAATVDGILGDPRSWIAGNDVRLQRVPQSAPYDFTVYLATPGTSESMCATAGLHTEKYTSCRLTGQVIINLGRWLTAIADYDAPVEVYQAYAINHEVGHELGHGHESCPGDGRPAPVMMQQTYGLKGCLANPFPFLDGHRYAGRPIP
jgi:hypothetical protein